jgi:hypothetical protein
MDSLESDHRAGRSKEVAVARRRRRTSAANEWTSARRLIRRIFQHSGATMTNLSAGRQTGCRSRSSPARNVVSHGGDTTLQRRSPSRLTQAEFWREQSAAVPQG